MNIFDTYKFSARLGLPAQVALVLILSLLFWALNVPLFMSSKASAAQLTLVSDTLTDSDTSVLAGHTIRFTSTSNATAGQVMSITFDPAGGAFGLSFSSATATDIQAIGMTVVSNATNCSGAASEVYPIGTGFGTVNESYDFTVCAGDTVTAGAKTIFIGTSTALITNPASVNSYRVVIGGTWADSGETRVAIIDDVVVTAAVATSFTFTVNGTTTGIGVNGTTTSTTTTATAIGFGTLSPGVVYTAAQRLEVTTNAASGFSVTVRQDQNLTSATGADIDTFFDGTAVVTPQAWQAPAATLGSEATYGHFGVTSEDSTLSGGDPFATNFWSGSIGSSTQVFYHNGPADGATAHQGRTVVGYQVQVSALQEAGNDYTNTLTYVATPIF